MKEIEINPTLQLKMPESGLNVLADHIGNTGLWSLASSPSICFIGAREPLPASELLEGKLDLILQRKAGRG